MKKLITLVVLVLGLVGVEGQGFRLLTFETITNMAAANPNSINYNCLVPLGGGYSRFFRYDASSVVSTNSTNVIAPTTGVGRWTELGLAIPSSDIIIITNITTLITNLFTIITNISTIITNINSTAIELLGSVTVPSINFTNGYGTKQWTLSANSFATNLVGINNSTTNEQTVQLDIIQSGSFGITWPGTVNLLECPQCLVPPVGTNIIIVQYNGLGTNAYSSGKLTTGRFPYADTPKTQADGPLIRVDSTTVGLNTTTNILTTSGSSLIYSNSNDAAFIVQDAAQQVTIQAVESGGVGLIKSSSSGLQFQVSGSAGFTLQAGNFIPISNNSYDMAQVSGNVWKDIAYQGSLYGKSATIGTNYSYVKITHTGENLPVTYDSSVVGTNRYSVHSFNIGGTNKVSIDATTTAGNTSLLLYDVDNNTVERVTVGAADSGGAGFKVLRIPN